MLRTPAQGCVRAWRRSLLSVASASRASALPSNSQRTYASVRKVENQVQQAFTRSEEIFKRYKPVSPGLRHLRRPLHPHLWEGRPVRALTIPKRKTGGRNITGRITVRHRGGGHKQRIRTIDFMRTTPGPHDVVRIEYDPGRSAHIALLMNRDPNAVGTQKWSYVIATEGMRAGDEVQSFRKGIPEGFIPGFDELRAKELEKAAANASSPDASAAAESSAETLAMGILRTMTLRPGNVLPLRLIPPGTVINNISLDPNGPARLVRSAGSWGQLVAHEEGSKYVQVKLQSGEVRKILRECSATIGKVSNAVWKNRQIGKAGRARWLGLRPEVRGVAMNACDHPHGGGRGKSKSNKHPRSIWGWGTKGTRTRKPGPKGPKNSNKLVVRERPRGVDLRSTN
ncbi:ribosomal protein L2 [Schizophyllum commune H4-8]|uniref:ribosomal protein L2 n=1 Tax=Schizophyllum commune (strain H4-8 / FGSC 9210) TaxID=578458 RepID=UPI002160E851|nr:ribosomal protein L2 [Schizophyllum commune H4-8]KAI5898205.1 ribosomal protein L2 [Schizophyllum commune H4-8]